MDSLSSGTILPMDICADPIPADLIVLRHFAETRDPEAFSQIVRRHGRVVYAASMRILGDQGRAQDVAQETFFRLMQNPSGVTQSLGGWLHRSATRLALDVRRSERARRDREQTYGQQHSAEHRDERSSNPRWAELSPLVDLALSRMDEPGRSLLIRHFLNGTPQAELAVELNLSPATVSRRIKSAMADLAKRLKADGACLGVAPLTAFLLHLQASPAPAAFALEMGKMQLIASLRGAVGPLWPLPSVAADYPASLPIRARRPLAEREPIPPAAMAGYLVMMILVAIYFLCLGMSLARVSPNPATVPAKPAVDQDTPWSLP
jgi:RNA polymerase sigma factor (sigma-70 family)